MRRVFADTSFWIGLREKADQFHGTARKIAGWLVQNRCTLVVTPFIFAEAHAHFCRITEIRELIIRDFWGNPLVQFEQPTHQEQSEAMEILRQQRDKTYSFADAVSFVVMSRMDLKEVVTFDAHFRQFGRFVVIDGRNL